MHTDLGRRAKGSSDGLGGRLDLHALARTRQRLTTPAQPPSSYRAEQVWVRRGGRTRRHHEATLRRVLEPLGAGARSESRDGPATPEAIVSRRARWWLLLWPSRRAPTTAARFCDSSKEGARRRSARAPARSQEQSGARCSPGADRDQQAAEPLSLRGRATVVGAETARPRVRLKGSNASRRTSGPDRTVLSMVSRETLASVAERNCYAGGR